MKSIVLNFKVVVLLVKVRSKGHLTKGLFKLENKHLEFILESFD